MQQEQPPAATRVLAGKTALVIGACQPNGTALAAALAAHGARVVLHCLSDDAAAATAAAAVNALNAVSATCTAIRASGGTAHVIHADSTQIQQLDALFEAAESACGGIDIVLGNALEAPAPQPLLDATLADYDVLLTRHAKASFFMLQQAGRRVRDDASIICVVPPAATASTPGSALYAGATATTALYCRVLAKEIGARGITVNSVTPASGATPQDIADLVVFLASDEARWITGQNIRTGTLATA